MTKWQGAIKWFFYALALLVLFFIETAILTRVRFFGVHPYLVPLVAAIAALFEGPFAGAGFGFAAGLLYDAFIPPAEGFYSIMFLICCFVVGTFCERVFRKNFVSALLWSLALTGVTQFVYFVLFLLLPAKADLSALFVVYLPEVGFTMLFSPVVYLMMRGIRKRFGERD